MNNYNIDIKNLLDESDNPMDAQVSCIVKSGELLYFGVNFRTPSPNCSNADYCYVVAYDLNAKSLLWSTKLPGKNNIINDYPIDIDNRIIAASSNQLAAMDKDTGNVIWQKTFKNNGSVELSSIGSRIFVSNWGELAEIDVSTGKKLKSIKPRVKWFDSGVIQYDSRFFVSTSNSKILELDESFNIVREFKFPGGWAIGCTPLIHKSKMIASSYGARSIVFDLNNNEADKKFQKAAGSKPNHLLIGDYYILHESIVCNRLSCFSLTKKKKLWSSDLSGIQGIWERDSDSAFIIFERDNSYVAGIIDIKNGNITSILDTGEPGIPDSYEFGLWDGISINSTSQGILLNYNPGFIKVCDAVVSNITQG